MSSVSYSSIQLQLETPIPFLESLMGKYVFVKLKWGWELKGILQARDAYMNLLLLHAEEYINGEGKGELG